MKKLTLLALLSGAALAASVGSRIRTVSGTGAQTMYIGGNLSHVGLACPYQVVAWKTCAGSGGQLDAGLGGCTAVTTATGHVTDYSTNADPIQVNMQGVDRISVVNVDAGTVACEGINLGP